MASFVPPEPRPVGFVHPRFGPGRAELGLRGAGQRAKRATYVEGEGIPRLCCALYSRLERYAGRRPKSSAGRLIDCEEDWTLRAVLVGMLREAER